MLNQVINVVAELRTFLIVCAVVSLVMGGFLLIFCRKFSFDGKNLKTIGFKFLLEELRIIGNLYNLVIYKFLFMLYNYNR